MRDWWDRNRPRGWSLAQRRGIGVLGLAACGLLAWRVWQRPAYLPDPPPDGPVVHDLRTTLDPNTASAADLTALPGVGPARAAALVAEREAGGPFAGPADLARVPGIGPAVIETLRPHLRFDHRTSADPADVQSGDEGFPPAAGRQ